MVRLVFLLLIMTMAGGFSVWLFIVSVRSRRAHRRYDEYARKLLKDRLQMTPCPVKEEYRVLKPFRAFGLFRVAGTLLRGDRFAWVNLSNSTIGLFMKMHTFFFRPDPAYNLPMLSIDVIFMGDKRVFVIEVIDPAKIADHALSDHYDRFRRLKPSEDLLANRPVSYWYRDVVTDFSIHARADRSSDALLFETYQKYLDAYLEMVRAAKPVPEEQSRQIAASAQWYVDTLISEGGPAVDMLGRLMGKEKMREYSRTVMFGLEP